MKKKLAGSIVAALLAASLLAGCMDDAMDKSKQGKPAQMPATTGK